MGLYLSSVTVNQACVAQGQVRRASARWIGCAAFFIGWNFAAADLGTSSGGSRSASRSTAGVLLRRSLYVVYRRPHERAEDVPQAGSTEELEARLAAARRAVSVVHRVATMGEHDAELILVAGALLAAGIVGALLADRIRIPGLLLFLGLGMLAGSEGIGGIDFNDAELARTLGTIALVLILFEGGLTAGWSEIRPVLGTAASLATVGTVVDRGGRRPRGEAGSSASAPSKGCWSGRRSPPPTRPRSSPSCAARRWRSGSPARSRASPG